MDETITNHQAEMPEAMLTPVQARVLGSLMEKQMTTPDYYPLTLNALVSACNQKSSRNPVMALDAAEVGRTVSELRREGLVTASMHGRADRYEQHLSRKLGLSSKERAVVCVLLLRGAQTLNEIRTNTGRMVEFAGNDEVQDILEGLIGREEPVALLLPRASGQREDRYTHLLCGAPEIQAPVVAQAITESTPVSVYEARIATLEAAVAELQAEVEQLKELNGL